MMKLIDCLHVHTTLMNDAHYFPIFIGIEPTDASGSEMFVRIVRDKIRIPYAISHGSFMNVLRNLIH